MTLITNSPSLAESAIESIGRIEKLFNSAHVVEVPDDVKLRAAQRAIDRRAPFHRQRNGIDDAILTETYADLVKSRKPGDRFAFVTHNTKDFSQPNASGLVPLSSI
jgi:PIN domain